MTHQLFPDRTQMIKPVIFLSTGLEQKSMRTWWRITVVTLQVRRRSCYNEPPCCGKKEESTRRPFNRQPILELSDFGLWQSFTPYGTALG